jgi:hypothetical protein
MKANNIQCFRQRASIVTQYVCHTEQNNEIYIIMYNTNFLNTQNINSI